MPLNIRDPRAAELAKELAARRKITMTAAIIEALQNEIKRERDKVPLRERLAQTRAHHARARRSQGTTGPSIRDRRYVEPIMFIDTSAVVSIIMGEPGGDRLADAIAAAKQRLTSPLVRLEACMVLSTRLDIAPRLAQKQFDAFLVEAGVTVIPVTDKIGAMAVAAFEQFGKGRSNKAKLNLADCMSYACAKSYRAPILFTGRDFAKTDLKIALV